MPRSRRSVLEEMPCRTKGCRVSDSQGLVVRGSIKASSMTKSDFLLPIRRRIVVDNRCDYAHHNRKDG
jgi:hypothetical protein